MEITETETRIHPAWVMLMLLASVGFAVAAVTMILMKMNSDRPEDIIGWMILGPGILSCMVGSVCLGIVTVWSIIDNRRAKV
jgi:hypothetical protein